MNWPAESGFLGSLSEALRLSPKSFGSSSIFNVHYGDILDPILPIQLQYLRSLNIFDTDPCFMYKIIMPVPVLGIVV